MLTNQCRTPAGNLYRFLEIGEFIHLVLMMSFDSLCLNVSVAFTIGETSLTLLLKSRVYSFSINDVFRQSLSQCLCSVYYWWNFLNLIIDKGRWVKTLKPDKMIVQSLNFQVKWRTTSYCSIASQC